MTLKKLISASAIAALAMFAVNANAGNIDTNAARAAAQNFLNSKSAGMLKATSSDAIKLAYSQPSSVSGNAYYVFNIDGGGWVVIAGDDRANQVLAYGTEGSLDMNNLPENMKGYMDRYQRQIEAVQKHNLPIKAAKAPKRVQAVAPLLKNINWAQQSPFNYQCPTYNGERASVGCAGLAMAQIVNYWKYPTEMPALGGYQNSYNYQYIGNLPARTMDYSLIRDQYTTWTDAGSLAWVDGVTDEEKQEVAWLCRYCSQACLMNFSPDGSGSNVLKQKNAFLTVGYSTDAKLLGIEAWPSRETWNTSDYSDDEWTAIMNQELVAGRPLPYSCEDWSDGHAFVVDGVDADGLYHVVWGWYGRGDGWFQHRAFDVTVQNQSMHFNDALFMVIDLYPYEGYVIPGDYDLGDVNHDGDVDVNDVTAIISYILGAEPTPFHLEQANVDGDAAGAIDVNDVTALISIILGAQ